MYGPWGGIVLPLIAFFIESRIILALIRHIRRKNE